MAPPGLSRRAVCKIGVAGLASFSAGSAFADTPNLSNVTIRAGTFKGQDQLILKSAGLSNTTYAVQYHEFNSGQLEVEAMNAGALDFGGWSEIPLAFGAAAGARIKVIAVLKGDVNNQVILVPKNSQIKTIADLKGKRVGYVRATTSHYYLLRMLWAADLQFSDIQAINLTPTDGAAAFRSGDLDAWAIYGYAINFALANGNARVLRTAKGILSGNYFIGASPDAIANPGLHAAISDYLQRMGKGYSWVEAHKQQWSEDLSPVIKVPLPYVEAQYFHESQPYRLVPIDEPAIASAQEVADTFVKAGVISANVDVAPYFDRSFTLALTSI